MQSVTPTYEELVRQIKALRTELEEANDTIDAIRTGQVDALIVHGEKGHELYTLKSADQTYRIFIEKMTEGAVTLNKDGIILYGNSRFAAMVNVPLSKVIGLPFVQFFDTKYHVRFLELFNQGWKEDSKDEFILNNAERSIVLLSLTTLELDEGVSLSIILTDITQQKENQKQLKAKNEELERANHALELSNHDLLQFASVASHDLQEPLRKIQIFSNLLHNKEAAVLSDESKVYLEKVLTSAERMKQLIVDILDYSKLSDNDNVLEKTDLSELMHSLLYDYEIMIQEKNATIQIGNLPVIEVNRGQMRQVFQNILSNALKFSRKDLHPLITVESKKIGRKAFDAEELDTGKYCQITIRDNGIGFDKKYSSNIFSLFKRLNAKDEYEGSGIGLAIAKKIIEKHNGLITAQSEEGLGAAFIIILPCSQKSTH